MTKSNPSKQSKGQVPSSSNAGTDGSDVVLVHGVTDDRKGLKVLRARDGNVESGEVRPLVESQPISNDVVRLRPRKEAPFICDVETTFSPKAPASSLDVAGEKRGTRGGPAQVATRAYRDNWDQIWSTRPTRGNRDLN